MQHLKLVVISAVEQLKSRISIQLEAISIILMQASVFKLGSFGPQYAQSFEMDSPERQDQTLFPGLLAPMNIRIPQ